MKICIVAPSVFPVRKDLPYGGTEALIWQLCNQLGKHKIDYTLLAPKGSDAPGGTLFETVTPKERDEKWTGEEEWDAFEKYEYAFDWKTDFDVIHDHSHQALPYKLRCQYPDLKMLHTCHGLQTWGRPGNMPQFYGKPNLLTLSKFHQEVTKAPLGSCTGGAGIDSRLVVHGVDTDVYKPGEPEDVTDRFLMFGLMSAHKGHVIPLKLWLDMHNGNASHGPLAVAGEDRFVGNKAYVRTVKELCEGPDDKPVAQYIGSVTQEEKIRLFQTSRAVFLPFLCDPGEAWSLIVLEALACGCPVITTPNGCILEMIEHGKTGFIISNDKELWEAAKKVHEIDRKYVAGAVGGRWDMDATFVSHMEHYQATAKGERWA